MGNDLIERQAAIDALDGNVIVTSRESAQAVMDYIRGCADRIRSLPSAQPERLTDDDFETIRIHLNAYKEKLCNQRRWKEADEYQRIIDRFMAFASAQPDLDSAYTEGYTAAESKYRKMWDEMQTTIKEKAFGKRKGLIHTADIDAMPTIEERKMGKWERHNTYHGDDVSGFVDPDWRCSECGRQANVNAWCMYDLTDFCPNCGARLVQGGEDNDRT